MRTPDSLTRLLANRFAKKPSWFKDEYEDAILRVEDHLDDEVLGDPNPYFYSPADESSASPGPIIIGFDGAGETPEEVRKRAFELLVLADAAEATWR